MNKFNVIGSVLGAVGMSSLLYISGVPTGEVIAFGVIGFTFSVVTTWVIYKVIE